MNAMAFEELAGWVTKAGLIGRSESELMAGFCRSIVDAGVPLTRAMVILDTLHPIYEGRVFRWRADMPDAVEAVDYGRTNEGEAAENWQRSPFYYLLQTGQETLRRRLITGDPTDFLAVEQLRGEGMTDYLALFIDLPPKRSSAKWIASIRPGRPMPPMVLTMAPSVR